MDNTFHITSRGARKETIFYDSMDHDNFLYILADTKQQHPFKLHAYCLMGNHFHHLMGIEDTSQSVIMKSIHQRYARYFNKKYNLTGHVFQSKYFAKPIDNPTHFLLASKYIHKNPVTAGIVTRPEDYLWSSYTEYILPTITHHSVIDTDTTHSLFMKNPLLPYKQYVEIAL